MKKSYLIIIIPLLVSMFIYMFYRTEKTVINEIVINLISQSHYLEFRETVNNLIPLNSIIIYSLPEGLWVFCVTLTSKFFYIQVFNRKINFEIIPLLFSVGLEILQLLNFTKGRFDILDIWVSVIFWFIAFHFYPYNIARQNIVNPLNFKSSVCIASYGIVYFSYVLE